MSDTSLSCRILNAADVKPATRLMAWAFIDDPLCSFMLPRQKSRLKALETFFNIYGEINIQYGRGYGVGEPLLGVAYWKSPHQEGISLSLKSLPMFFPLLLSAYTRGYFRAKEILRKIDEMHRKYAHEPHYSLDNIGVLESARGKGVASLLIRPFLEKADEEKIGAFTVTATPSNVPLYEHFGFRCMEEVTMPGTGVTVWALKRDPHS